MHQLVSCLTDRIHPELQFLAQSFGTPEVPGRATACISWLLSMFDLTQVYDLHSGTSSSVIHDIRPIFPITSTTDVTSVIGLVVKFSVAKT